MEKKFIILYQEVRPIILKLRKTYQIQLWEHDDWEQEGMIVLYHLLKNQPELMNNNLLFTYFKTKFSNYIKDQLRKQESQKRRLNKVVYDEISEVGHRIPSREMLVADRIAYEEMMSHVKKQLTVEERESMERVMTGERFSGRANIVRKLKTLMEEYDKER